MLSDAPPFYSKNKGKCQKIDVKDYQRPCFSLQAQSLLKGILTKDPAFRLDQNGIQEIKKHNFFIGTDWYFAPEYESRKKKDKKFIDYQYFRFDNQYFHAFFQPTYNSNSAIPKDNLLFNYFNLKPQTL